MLWIDFKLYFYVRIHKQRCTPSRRRKVVNWFQIVFLRENSQERSRIRWYDFCCELISNCIFTWEFTRKRRFPKADSELWIDFKLYFYVRIHKCVIFNINIKTVVNWFQIVFLRENSQVVNQIKLLHNCCELISNCIFTWEFTSYSYSLTIGDTLWIDFKLYFYVRIHKVNPKMLSKINTLGFLFWNQKTGALSRLAQRILLFFYSKP